MVPRFQIQTDAPLSASITATGMTSCVTSDVPLSPRITTTSITAPIAGATRKTVNTVATGVGQCHDTFACQYTSAHIVATAPWAKLNTPDVAYVTTSPDAAIAYTAPSATPSTVYATQPSTSNASISPSTARPTRSSTGG